MQYLVNTQIKSNLFAINKVHNKQFIKITYHLAGQTGDSFAVTVDWLLLTRWRSVVRHVTMRARATRRVVS